MRVLPRSALALVLLVAGCAAPTQPLLDNARLRCANGDMQACDALPGFEASVASEHNQQAREAAGGVLAALAAVVLVGAAV
jgi:hypothetical protein